MIVRVIEQSGVSPRRAYQFLIETARALSRDGYDINVLSEEQIITILKGAQETTYDFSIIPEITKRMILSPEKNIKQILSDLRIREIKKGDLQRFYKEAIKEYETEQMHYKKSREENKQRKAQKITGIIVRRLHGGYSGKKIYDYVIEQLSKKGTK
jgi:Glu-tRNA(Gln) amidotransferase subunit E-like FAD-binding protein